MKVFCLFRLPHSPVIENGRVMVFNTRSEARKHRRDREYIREMNLIESKRRRENEKTKPND